MPIAEEHASTLPAGRASEAYCGTCNRSFPIEHSTCPNDGTLLVQFKERTDALIGRELDGRYRIEARLGEGGMGAVYRARQLSVDRLVAIKVMHPALAADREIAKRFLREARLASSLAAPGIATVFEFGQTDDGLLYLVMELIDGTPLDRHIKQGRFDPARLVNIALQLCDALEVAHTAGIVHRDLKPGNIIVLDTPTGEVVKVLDFGIAKIADAPSITSTRGAVGTPMYMAPEQFDGRADSRSDLYSLGCVLYELASGAPPFSAPDLAVLYTHHLTEPPPRLPHDVPSELNAAITRLLAKKPADRFASVAELRDALATVQTVRIGSAPIIRTSLTPIPQLPRGMTMPGETSGLETRSASPPAPTPVPAATEPARRRGVWLLLVVAALVAGAAGVVGYVVTHHGDGSAARSSASEEPAPPPAPSVVVPMTVAEPAPAAAISDAGVVQATATEPTTTAPTMAPVTTAPTTKAPATTTRPPAKRRPPAVKKKPTGTVELPFAPT